MSRSKVALIAMSVLRARHYKGVAKWLTLHGWRAKNYLIDGQLHLNLSSEYKCTRRRSPDQWIRYNKAYNYAMRIKKGGKKR